METIANFTPTTDDAAPGINVALVACLCFCALAWAAIAYLAFVLA